MTQFLSEQEFEALEAISATFASGGKFRPGTPGLGVAEGVANAIHNDASPQEQSDFRRALSIIDNPIANLVLAGNPKRLRAMNTKERERVLRAWSNSQIGLLRKGFQTFKRLALFHEYALIPEGANRNPNWDRIGYPGLVEPQNAEKTISTKSIERDTALEADVIVIGSGAGGGVVAAELAAAGQRVIILEKGSYRNEADFDGGEWKAMRDLYEKRGILTTDDVGIVTLAGSTLGGGTTINWTTSLTTPPHVLEEWDRELGVAGATGDEWRSSLEAVSRRLSVNSRSSVENRQNALLRAGSETLGYRWRTLPRNVDNCHDCGHCLFGCRFGTKQSTLKSYLQDAFDNGADFVTDCHADRLTIEGGEVRGVEASVNGHKLWVRGRLVVVCAGSVHSPALLQRSELTNPNIGRHLHLHPAPGAFGIFDEPVEAWNGVMQSVACVEFEAPEDGYGFVVEVPPAHPGLAALALPWQDARSHHDLMGQVANMAIFGALVRDQDSGRVEVDRDGNPVLKYSLSAGDTATVMRALKECVKLLVAAGARTVGSLYNSAPSFSTASEEGASTLLDRLDRRGYLPNDMFLFSAHQMSSCRMGGDPSMAAFDPDGESYEVKNLYIADGSALPNAPGVNPMISIMGLAHRNAQIIKSRL